MDTTNPYAVSEASIEGASATTGPSPTVPFHAVTPRKVAIMMAATVGIYSVVWFYRNWTRLKTVAGEDIWPVPRAIFGAFTFFGLRTRIQEVFAQHERIQPERLASAPIVYLVCAFLSGRGGRAAADLPVLELALIVLPLLGQIWAMTIAQGAINELVEGAADGAQPDDDFGGLSLAAIAFGILFWFLVFFGTFAPA